MATLKIENLPSDIYDRLRALAEVEGRSLSAEVIHLLDRVTAEPETHSILELRGHGKEHWTGVSAAEHVRRERDSWP